MKPNEGSIDRTLRIAVGILLLSLTYTGAIGMWGWGGVVPLLTGLIGWCPLYTVFGINTCSMKKPR
jgi:hypothetical protein